MLETDKAKWLEDILMVGEGRDVITLYRYAERH